MALDYYDAKGKTWVSPRLVLHYYNRLLKERGNALFNDRKFYKVLEAKPVAIALLGIHKSTGITYMMQVPAAVNDSPDIVTMTLKEYLDKPVQMEIQDVEVVEYGEDAKEDLATFLINTKLSPTISGQAYDSKTIVMCHITRKYLLINPKTLHYEIKKQNPKAAVCLISQMPLSGHIYSFTRIWPELDSGIDFDVIEECNNYPIPDACKFSLGMNKKIVIGKSTLPLPTSEEVFEFS